MTMFESQYPREAESRSATEAVQRLNQDEPEEGLMARVAEINGTLESLDAPWRDAGYGETRGEPRVELNAVLRNGTPIKIAQKLGEYPYAGPVGFIPEFWKPKSPAHYRVQIGDETRDVRISEDFLGMKAGHGLGVWEHRLYDLPYAPEGPLTEDMEWLAAALGRQPTVVRNIETGDACLVDGDSGEVIAVSPTALAGAITALARTAVAEVAVGTAPVPVPGKRARRWIPLLRDL